MSKIEKMCNVLGLNPMTSVRLIRQLPRYYREYSRFKAQLKSSGSEFQLGNIRPMLNETVCESGNAKGVYFNQDLSVAQRIFENNPSKHVDVGSRIDGFVAHVASFRDIEVLDIRPLSSCIKHVVFRQLDLMHELPKEFVEYTDSLSCLHTLEHFGLGRYGDAIDANGHVQGFENLSRLLKRGGRFYLSVPLGELRVEFNAHRVFSLEYLLKWVEATYRLERFTYVDDEGDLHENVTLTPSLILNNCSCHYGCAILELTKVK